MAFSGMLLAVLSCMALLAVTAVHWSALSMALVSAAGLAQWLEGEGSQQCWEALVELKSCMGEIILYLLNGEAYLGSGCCRAIRIIEQSCWAADAMLSVIGFIPDEGDMLKANVTTAPGSMDRRRSRAAARDSITAVAGGKSAPVHR